MVGGFGLGLMKNTPSPVISDLSMTNTTITQLGSTTITFKATDMISTDIAFVEVSGKSIIKKASSSDYLNYTIILYGADLPIMSSNTLIIKAINTNGSDEDTTLELTVTAVPSVIPSYKFKESITIPDEVDLIINLLKTNTINHRLKHIVPLDNIYKEQPMNWKEFPGMYIRKVANVTMMTRESLGEDYDTGVEKFVNVWQCDIAFDLVAHVKTIFNYPPIVTDGEENSIRYEHAKNCLPVMRTLLHTILSENLQYVDPDGSTLQWDFVEEQDFNLIDGGYAGARDVWAFQLLYRFQFEMEVE